MPIWLAKRSRPKLAYQKYFSPPGGCAAPVRTCQRLIGTSGIELKSMKRSISRGLRFTILIVRLPAKMLTPRCLRSVRTHGTPFPTCETVQLASAVSSACLDGRND
jgi:hypothetical protein